MPGQHPPHICTLIELPSACLQWLTPDREHRWPCNIRAAAVGRRRGGAAVSATGTLSNPEPGFGCSPVGTRHWLPQSVASRHSGSRGGVTPRRCGCLSAASAIAACGSPMQATWCAANYPYCVSTSWLLKLWTIMNSEAYLRRRLPVPPNVSGMVWGCSISTPLSLPIDQPDCGSFAVRSSARHGFPCCTTPATWCVFAALRPSFVAEHVCAPSVRLWWL